MVVSRQEPAARVSRSSSGLLIRLQSDLAAQAPRELALMSLAVVTCLFNPFSYERRWTAWDEFIAGMRESDPRPVVYCVELLWGDQVPRALAGADEHIALHAGQRDCVLFQKEALINVGIEAARRVGHRRVAVLDADVKFQRGDWVKHVSVALDRADVVQCAETVVQHYTDKGAVRRPGAAMKFVRNAKTDGHPGGAWAYGVNALPRDVPLYDRAVIGNGDRCVWYAILSAASGREPLDVPGAPMFKHGSNDVRAHWRAWAMRIKRLKIDYARLTVELLSHGSLANRRYQSRAPLYSTLCPERDVVRCDDGVLRWTDENPSLASAVYHYMRERNDDDVVIDEPHIRELLEAMK